MTPLLTPIPQQLQWLDETYALAPGLLALNLAHPQKLLPSAQVLRDEIQKNADVRLEIVAGNPLPAKTGITLTQNAQADLPPQGYSLEITAAGVQIEAASDAGLFYGIQTLRQLLLQTQGDLPGLRIRDWPDFENRGVMLDISRDRVPTMETLFGLIDMLAGFKINQFQLYTEHTFAYQRHPVVWEKASPLTGEEILILDAYCQERFIELVPNQNTFGHMTRWLKLEPYAHLTEAPDGWTAPWGQHYDYPFTLTPTDESLALVDDLLDELMPHFSSRQLNVNADETFDLGQGVSKGLVEKLGVGRVYLDFLLRIYENVKARGLTMQFWGDIIVQHPDLVPELPRDLIALEWGYEGDHPFDAHGEIFAKSGIPFYVCPGTSSWRSLAGRTDNALANLRNAAENGLKHGAIGYLNTDWGDEGHMQPLPTSYLGFMMGAALAWASTPNQGLDVPAALDAFVFRDEAGVMGKLVYDLGNVYKALEMPSFNSSFLFSSLLLSADDLARTGYGPDGTSREQCNTVLAHIQEIMEPLSSARIQRPDAQLILQEFNWVAGMMWHSCRRIAWINSRAAGQEDIELRQTLSTEIEGLIEAYHHLWHQRSRPSGFEDSVIRLQKLREEYKPN